MAEIRSRTTRLAERERLVAQLVHRLRDDLDSREQPIAIVNVMPHTRTTHILVVWDTWKDLSLSERAAVIVQAFAASGRGDPNGVILALGVTSLEAVQQGHLPFRIVPLNRAEDNVSGEEILEAMKSVGGIFLRVGSEVQLRFPTEEMAEDAYRELFAKIPKPIWGM